MKSYKKSKMIEIQLRLQGEIFISAKDRKILQQVILIICSCPHITPRPGSPGKIYWLSGPPGAGKSTTCQLMARKKDFRYFEADCTMQLVNPFTDIHVDNPSVASFSSKSLKVSLFGALLFIVCE